MTGETYGGQEQDERLANPNEWFVQKYGREIVKYGDFPPMPLEGLTQAERTMRGSEAVDGADPVVRAARYVQLLHEAGGLRPEDEDLLLRFPPEQAEQQG